MPTVTVDAHFSDYDDGTSFSWPAASVACSAGDVILANLGSQLSYTSTDGATTITFGQFWTGSAWSGTGSPYVNVAATVNLEDENFADIEILAAIDYYVDAHTGEYPVHTKAGHHAIHGGHIRSKAVGKRHTHPHHQTKHHWHNVVFSTSATNTTAGTCTVSCTQGYLQLDDGSLGNGGNPFPATSIPNVPKDNYFVFNNSSAAVDGIAAVSFGFLASTTDFTTDARINHHIIGRVSSNVDPQTGQYSLEGWHVNQHQAHGGHIAGNAVAETHIGTGQVHGGEGGHKDHHAPVSHARRHQQQSTPHRIHSSGVIFWITATNTTAATCTVNWTSGFLYNDSGGVYTITAGSFAGIPAGAYFGYNTTGAQINASYGSAQWFPANSLGWVTLSNDFSQASQDPIIVVGRVSQVADNKTNQYSFSHHIPGAHQVHGQHVADNAIYEGHILAGNVHGGEGGHANHIAALAIDGGAHDHIIHNSLDGDIHINKNGHIRSTHVGAGEIHGGESSNPDHHAPQSHARRHQLKALPHRYHADGVIFSVSNSSGGTCTVSWTGPGVLQADDNTGHTISASSYTGVPNGAYFGYNTTGAQINASYGSANFFPANGIGWVTQQNDFSQASQDPIIVLGRLSTITDPQTGQYVFNHHMGGAHQVHGGHVATSSLVQHHHSWLNPVGATLVDNGSQAAILKSSTNDYTVSTLRTASLSLTTAQFNAAHSNGWLVAVGESTTSGNSTGPFSSYTQPVNTTISGNSGAQNVGSSTPDGTLWADGSSNYGIIIQSIAITSSSVTFKYRAVTYNNATLAQPYMYVWAQLQGMNSG